MQSPSPFDKPEDAGSNPNPNPNPYGQPSPPNASPYGQPAAPSPNASPYNSQQGNQPPQNPYGQPAAPPPPPPYGSAGMPGGAGQSYASGSFLPGTYPPGLAPIDVANKKMIAGICGILLGWLGVHKFILGYNQEGAILAAASIIGGICTCGILTAVCSVVGLIEGIMYLTKNDQDFYNTYFVNKRPWF